MKLPKYKYVLAIIDFIIILFSFYEARFVSLLTLRRIPEIYFPNLFGISLNFLFFTFLLSSVFIFVLQNNNLYKRNIFLSTTKHLVSIIRSIFYCSLILIIISFAFKLSLIIESRILVLTFIVVLLFNLITFRIILLPRLLKYFSGIKPLRRKLLIVGAGKSGKLLGTKIHFEHTLGFDILGFVDDYSRINEKVVLDYVVLGNTACINSVVQKFQVQDIIISIDNITHEKLIKIIELCNNTNAIVRVNSGLFKIVSEKYPTEAILDFDAIEISPRINDRFNFIFKRIIDFILSFVAIIMLSPLLILIGLIIKLTSKGPILYSQKRIGKNGRQFKFYKFRSMTISNESDETRKEQMLEFMKGNLNGNSAKVINESRVTWIGKVIRKTSLDELPQFINVLMGDMSLVGPRPCLVYEFDNYDEWQKKRVSVVPGCTGLWQVAGRSNVSFVDSVIMDIYYINNMSPWLDLQLMLKTIPVMFFGRGGK